MKKVKRNIIIAAVLLFVCAAVYLNWSYNNSWGAADPAMVKAEDENMASLGTDTDAEPASDYFAQARLTRQTSRDEALGLLETAAASEGASQETIDASMDAIAAMATWSMQETQIENLLLAKNFADAVVYISSDGVTVAVPAPVEGLNSAEVAQITETVIGETGCTAEDIRVIEVKGGGNASVTSTPAPSPAASPAHEASGAAESLDTADTE